MTSLIRGDLATAKGVQPGGHSQPQQGQGVGVTMRIVANVNDGRPDVPDGGQKGVITMYPLPGGSGVVEVAPNWTLTPPWVNHNVPIN